MKIAINDAAPTHECPRHGVHKATMHIMVSGVLKRVYCLTCYVEFLDRSGVSEMDEIAAGSPAKGK